jgi:hypothetical protein
MCDVVSGLDIQKAQKAALIAWTAFLFVLMNLSRTARSAAAFGGRRSLTSSSTRTTCIQAIKPATPISHSEDIVLPLAQKW